MAVSAGIFAVGTIISAVSSNQSRQQAKGVANTASRNAKRARNEANRRRRNEESSDALLRQRNAARSRQRARLASLSGGSPGLLAPGAGTGGGAGKTLIGQ